MRPTYSGLIGFSCEKVYDSLHHPARGCFAGMNSSGDDDALFLLRLIVERRSSYRQVVDIVARESTAQQAQLGESRLHRIRGDSGQILLKIAVRVGITVSQIDGVLVVGKGDVESQRVLFLFLVTGINKNS